MTWKNDLEAALVDAFPQPQEFDRAVAYINRRRTDYSIGPTFPEIAHAVIAAADSGGWTRDLVRGVLWFKPGNSRLQQFRETNVSLAPTSLKDQERELIASTIKETFPSYQDLANVVTNDLQQNLDVIAHRQSGTPPAEASTYLIAWFDARGAVKDVIGACVKARPEAALVTASKCVLAAIKSREVAAGFRMGDPYDTCLIDQQVFLGRPALRTVLRAWSPQPRKRVLAVNGPARSGKTYSLELVRHIAARTKSIQVSSIDLADENLSMFSPSLLARRVMLQMGHANMLSFTPKAEDAGSDARLARELCDWLTATARESTTTWVIVIDGSHLGQVREETRDMIRELVKRASAVDSPLRVMLLGYTDDLLPLDVRNRIADEQLRMLTEQELRDYLEKLVDQLAIETEDGVIDDIVDGVKGKTALASIESVAAEVQRWIDELQGVAP